MLYVQSSSPDYTLLVYDWSRSKLLASLELEVEAQRIAAPVGGQGIGKICTCGPDHLCFWSVGSGGRDLKACEPVRGLDKAVSSVDGEGGNGELTDCAWLHDNQRVVAVTSSGNVIICTENEVIQTWRNAHDGKRITCVMAFEEGVTGAATVGYEDDVAGFITLGVDGIFCIFHYNKPGDNGVAKFPYVARRIERD